MKRIFGICFFVLSTLISQFGVCNPSATFKDGAILSYSKNTLILNHKDVTYKTAVQEEMGELKKIDTYEITKNIEAAHLHYDNAGVPIELIVVRKGKKLNVVWQGAVTFKGDIGERIRTATQFIDVDGDGFKDIVKGIQYQTAKLCGATSLPLLFKEVFDTKKNKFIAKQFVDPSLINLNKVTDLKAKEITGSTSLLSYLSAQTASSNKGANNNPLLLTAPFSLVDNDLSTGWTPNSAPGTGEFVTFKTISTDWKIESVGIGLNEPTQKQKFTSPKSILLVTDKETFRLKLSGNKTNWFSFETPIHTPCVSLVIEEPSKGKLPVTFFEIFVKTEIDGAKGLEKLVSLLDDSEKGVNAQSILRTVKTAPSYILKRWQKLSPKAKRLAAQILADNAPINGINQIIEVAIEDGQFLKRDALRAITRAENKSIQKLSEYLAHTQDDYFKRASEMLVALNTPEAFNALLTSPHTQSNRNVVTAKYLQKMVSTSSTVKPLLKAHLETFNAKKLTPFDFAILGMTTTIPSLSKDAVKIALTAFNNSKTFNTQYFALKTVLNTQTKKLQTFWIDLTKNSNRIFRQLAATALGEYKGKPVFNTLKHLALKDPHVAVQINALAALLQFKKEDKKSLVTKAIQNQWPQIRSLALKNAAHLKKEKAQLIKLGLTDKNRTVLIDALNLAGTVLNDAQITAKIVTLMNNEFHPAILEKAATTAGERCQKDDASLDALLNLLQIGAEPLADTSQKVVAISAAAALGKIGSKKAIAHLKKAKQRSNPSTDKAILSALEASKSGCAVLK